MFAKVLEFELFKRIPGPPPSSLPALWPRSLELQEYFVFERKYSRLVPHSLINIIWQTLDLQILVRKKVDKQFLFIAALLDWSSPRLRQNSNPTKSVAWLNSVFTVQFIFYLKYLYFASIIRLAPLEKLTNISSQS